MPFLTILKRCEFLVVCIAMVMVLSGVWVAFQPYRNVVFLGVCSTSPVCRCYVGWGWG